MLFAGLTHHFISRCKQRGFSEFDVDLIINFGEEQHHEGREIYSITKASLKKLKHYLGKSNIANECFNRLRGAYVVVDNGLLITVARKTKHAKRDR